MSSTMTVLISMSVGLIAMVLILSLIKIFKDKKVTEEEKKQLQEIIITTLNKAIELSYLRSEQEFKDFCVVEIMKQLEENNIKGVNEKSIRGMIDLVLKINTEISEKLNKKVDKKR